LRDRAIESLADIKVLAVGSLAFAFVAFAASCQVHSDWWEGLLVDLGVTALGVFITVALVDNIVERADERRWGKFREIAYDRIRVASARLLFTISRLNHDYDPDWKFHISAEVMRTHSYRFWEHFLARNGWREFVRETVIPNIKDFLPEMGDKLPTWIGREIQAVYEEYESALVTFARVLEPEHLEHITEIQMWIREYQTESPWEGQWENQRWYITNALKIAILLVDSLGSIPEPISLRNDLRYKGTFTEDVYE
jgi:hypothetical protein